MKKVKEKLNFIENIIKEDLKNKYTKKNLKFRFPPEPNGFLHIGHVKAMELNFSLGKKYKSDVNLRFDDTNPLKENINYVNEIIENLKWLGYKYKKICYASDYFEKLYNWAIYLIKNSKAYVDSQDSERIAEQKGTPYKKGKNSPFRDRSIEENLELFNNMKNGKYKEGEHVLRAKIDMSSPNMLMRDPVMYRILYKEHFRTKNNWCIYPLYDWTHGQSDYIEKISHSLCSLEFRPHRDLYDWFLKQLPDFKYKKPKQIEFARLNLSYTVMSKRKLSFLVDKGIVDGWDDPRMPTISGLRRRGYPSTALRKFVEIAGIAKRENIIDIALLDFCAREELNKTSNRLMVVSNPLKVVISNYESEGEELYGENNPEDKSQGERKIRFSKEIYIEKEDFKEISNRKFHRLSIGKEVRLKNAYIIKAERVIKNSKGEIKEVHCTYDKKSKSGSGTLESQRKVKGTIHWVDKKSSIPVKINKYESLFLNEMPDTEKNEEMLKNINDNSLEVLEGFAEKAVLKCKPEQKFQFQRLGYYIVDKKSDKSNIIFNKTVSLREKRISRNPQY
ncbi:MAG: glutamine--tRNA ligase/YqeY domain fusion protein [Bacteroidota bacterium]|nr:glutamine--tRNA ligase/YqeY domain fusion protein [Bacteroidota bacterium]